MTTLLRVEQEYGSDDHMLTVLRPGCHDWLERLAAAYRALRTATAVDIDSLDLGQLQILTPERLKERIRNASIAKRRGGNFDVLRSDIAEMALLLHVEEEFGCTFGALSVRDRELTAIPGRGIDLIGVELVSSTTENVDGDSADDTAADTEAPVMVLVLGEAKVSAEGKSPPKVVDGSDMSLRTQHLANFADVDATADKVVRAAMAATDPTVAAAMQFAAEALRLGFFHLLKVAATSMMVRPASQGQATDFGSFHSAPGDYAPAVVRFLLLRLDDDDIEGLVDRFLELATSVDQDDEGREEM